MLATVIILAIEPKKRRAICDRVKRIPVITVLVAVALGFGVGWLVFGRGNTPPPKPDAFIGHVVEWVNGGGQPNTSWLVGTNGERYWIPNTSIFHCLVKEGHTDRGPQSSAVLDGLPDSGKWASCPAAVNRAYYIGHIVEWANDGGQPNISWLVGTNGERSWIPSKTVFYCLVNKGHTTLGPQSPTVLDDLPDLGQRASCP